MSASVNNELIIIGIGNSGRQDDGLGWALLDSIKSKASEKTVIEYRYQLQIEDAELISKFNKVIFVDASKNELTDGHSLDKCVASNEHSFSTHALVPETILYLSENLYNLNPEAYVFQIQGYKWELEIGLTNRAKENLNNAVDFFTENIPI